MPINRFFSKNIWAFTSAGVITALGLVKPSFTYKNIYGLFLPDREMKEWIYGRNPVREVLRANRRDFFQLQIARGAREKGLISEIIQLGQERKLTIQRPARQELDRISKNHQGVVLQSSGYPYSSLGEMFEKLIESSYPAFFLLLDTLQDPQNLGTLLRSAEAVGVHGILLPLRQTATVTPAVVSVSSGASEHLMIAQTNLAQAMETLKQNDVWLIGLDSGNEAILPEEIDLTIPLGLVVGSEGEGMRRLVRQSCDLLLRLPMRGKVASLNAASAGTVALYLAWQARKFNL